MPKIQLLESAVSDQIAAGEVVERPSSVVKELLENSIDAGARRLRVELEECGRRLIRVSDDGEGMDAEDLSLCVKRHATSKIRSAADLFSLRSFGFRGEALPSIASVSQFRLSSRQKGASQGYCIEVEGGRLGESRPAGRAEGTTVEVRQLFFNTPARLKFLKAPATELNRVQSEMAQLALAHPGLAFQLSSDGRTLMDLESSSPEGRLRQLWGASLADAALPVEHTEAGLAIRGWVAPPQHCRSNRSGQWLYVNGRPVEHRLCGFHLGQAFGSLLPHGRHPVCALALDMESGSVDVNVHPAKREVRFRQEAAVLNALRHAVEASLRKAQLYVSIPASASTAPAPADLGEYVTAEAVAAPLPLAVSASGPPTHATPSAWNLPRAAAAPPAWPQPLAQLHRAYLLCQDAQGLVVVDQHAAHERVLYERQLKAWSAGAVKSQRLLLPQRLQLSEQQATALGAWAPRLAELGLELQDTGGGLFFVTALPEFMRQVQAGSLLADLLGESPEPGQPASGDPAEDFRREAAASLACRAAVKAGDPLSWEQMQQLMADLAACEIPWACPHGRPPLVRLSLVELEKLFQRR